MVLLDFGASRRFKAAFTHAYKDLLKATLRGDRDEMAQAAEKVGYKLGPEGSRYRELLLDLFHLVLEPIRCEGEYDFERSEIGERASALAEELRDYKKFWEAPPVDAAYIHRKIVGFYMLAGRLGAKVNVRELLLPWLD